MSCSGRQRTMHRAASRRREVRRRVRATAACQGPVQKRPPAASHPPSRRTRLEDVIHRGEAIGQTRQLRWQLSAVPPKTDATVRQLEGVGPIESVCAESEVLKWHRRQDGRTDAREIGQQIVLQVEPLSLDSEASASGSSQSRLWCACSTVSDAQRPSASGRR